MKLILFSQLSDSSSRFQYLLHYDASIAKASTAVLVQSIKQAGGIVSSYIPDHTLLVIAQPKSVEALKQLEGLALCQQASCHNSLPHAIQGTLSALELSSATGS